MVLFSPTLNIIEPILIDISKQSFREIQQLELKTNKGNPYEKISVRLDLHCRTIKLNDKDEIVKIVTVTITNTSDSDSNNLEEYLIFQSQLNVKSDHGFQPYPNASQLEADISSEDKKFDMLYGNEHNYAFGQNCSVYWDINNRNIKELSSTFIPTYEIKTMTPDIEITDAQGNKKSLEIHHCDIASCIEQRELESILNPLINGYEKWHSELKLVNVNKYYGEVYQETINDIDKAINRIKKGLELITHPENKIIFECFKLTNLAMLMQMCHGKKQRFIKFEDGGLIFDKPYLNKFDNLDYKTLESLSNSIKSEISTQEIHEWKNYKWRGFQIAFLLMSIESIINKDSIEREEVDLIWFPTGGGKTEAYLSVAAFSMIYRRMLNQNDNGVDVIMRYTLRLLTADQFQRSTRLVCSLEYIRSKLENTLGSKAYSIGLWVGSSSIPNYNKSAANLLSKYIDNKTPKFPIDMCPWCGAEMTVTDSKVYYGYKYTDKLTLYCPDDSCHFREQLPIVIIDEEIYKEKPTFLIGTIDKFVQLTWNPSIRYLFGLDGNGKRINSPPNLIIQDELHLISGPLGTLTGIYESLIEWLCTDRRYGKNVLPKVVCATATIKAYREQINSLFGRGKEKSNLFPPNGIDINDNYFSKVLKNDKDRDVVAPGRKYVGIYAFTQGKLQSQVQAVSSLITSVSNIPDVESQRDPFWTILSFYNTINDIGKAKTLCELDIPNNISNYYHLRGIKEGRKLNQNKVVELTSRMASDDIGGALKHISESYSSKNNKSLDVVIASNIIEVGVDIDRLSLMTINGQPYTTAQYIQVSGRVGRRVKERPGLVVTIYNPLSSNDKSRFEHFNEYHQRLYSQVEESSVTPFSRFAIDKGVPAVIIGFLRQSFSKNGLGKRPCIEEIEDNINKIQDFIRYLFKRMENVDPTEEDFFHEIINNTMNDFYNNSYSLWEYDINKNLLNGYMAPITQDQDDIPSNVKPIMFSMRSVDAVSKLNLIEIKKQFNSRIFITK